MGWELKLTDFARHPNKMGIYLLCLRWSTIQPCTEWNWCEWHGQSENELAEGELGRVGAPAMLRVCLYEILWSHALFVNEVKMSAISHYILHCHWVYSVVLYIVVLISKPSFKSQIENFTGVTKPLTSLVERHACLVME